MEICDFNHLILYAKGWYKRTDFLKDVRKILAHRCGTEKKYMSNQDIWALLVHASEKYLSEYERIEVMSRMFSGSHVDDNAKVCNFLKWQGQTSWIRPAKMIVGKLSCLEVKNVLNLGRPDPKILPLHDENTLTRYDELNKV